jgi:beta-lactamase class D
MNIKFFLAALLSFSYFSCSVNKAKIDNSVKKYFDAHNVEGCFTMLRNTDGEITVYNMALDTQRFQPASTFNLITSLVGLQTGRITSEDMVVRWDRVNRPQKEWNRNLNMKDAFRVNSDPYFSEIVKRIGTDTLKAWIDSLSYGNRNVAGGTDSVWKNNTLLISPDEQLGLLKKLYFDQLPFRKSVMLAVRNAMVKEENTLYKLSYVTGSGTDPGNKRIGWVTGWIEENLHVYFFVTFIRSANPSADMNRMQVDITRDILKEYGFFQGKK